MHNYKNDWVYWGQIGTYITIYCLSCCTNFGEFRINCFLQGYIGLLTHHTLWNQIIGKKLMCKRCFKLIWNLVSALQITIFCTILILMSVGVMNFLKNTQNIIHCEPYIQNLWSSFYYCVITWICTKLVCVPLLSTCMVTIKN